MVERLRVLLERPLDPGVSRAVVVLAVAASTGFTIVVLLGGIGDRPVGGSQKGRPTGSPGTVSARSASGPLPVPNRQDPQDRPGTAAHRRAIREVDEHRALQHLPYRSGGLSIELVGARRGWAVLRVRAATASAARHDWRVFLRHFHDRGTAYLLVFEGGRRRG